MRFAASGNFLLVVGLFFLPWIDVRCQMAGQQSKSIVEQSGYQIAVGEYSEGEMVKELEKDLGAAGGGGVIKKKEDNPDDKKKPDPAPLLWGFVAMLGVGALLCIAIPGKMWRAGAAIGAIGAVLVLSIQSMQGFPVEQKMKEWEEKNKPKEPAAKGPVNLDLGAFAPKPIVTYKPAYYLTWLLTVLPFLWIAIDAMTAKPPPERGRTRYDEYDDERRRRDDDDDDDRPRERRRDQYDDD